MWSLTFGIVGMAVWGPRRPGTPMPDALAPTPHAAPPAGSVRDGGAGGRRRLERRGHDGRPEWSAAEGGGLRQPLALPRPSADSDEGRVAALVDPECERGEPHHRQHRQPRVLAVA